MTGVFAHTGRISRSALAITSVLACLASGASYADAEPTAQYREVRPPGRAGAITLLESPARADDSPEVWFVRKGGLSVRNVHASTLTPYLPAKGKGTGAAIVLAPGGAFRMLAIEAEGERVAKWFTARGIAVFVLKYRLRATSRDGSRFLAEMDNIAKLVAADPHASETPDYAFEDGLAALQVVRDNARRWGIDPRRVGVAGFSAGARLSRDLALHAPAGKGPDFAATIYGPMIAVDVPASAPPLFAALAVDDPVFGNTDLGIINSWRQANKPVEAHLYQKGGHGFGAGRKGETNALWMEQFHTWLGMNGFLSDTVHGMHSRDREQG
ncbi:alpha/beta hydrolase [Novosphingobium profundi]|uniref:alpha/beta hydrolase n=1 Tax=Novosphingobium profundi TaxID=1774954 RepID=UPI001BD9F18C|nr:alpha/beta hydrolase [Novosphingobium profundi]MBT0667427.1 alpha/beta hydrolase [Novosphingobium profundi]